MGPFPWANMARRKVDERVPDWLFESRLVRTSGSSLLEGPELVRALEALRESLVAFDGDVTGDATEVIVRLQTRGGTSADASAVAAVAIERALDASNLRSEYRFGTVRPFGGTDVV
jgi:hypothetical protein